MKPACSARLQPNKAFQPTSLPPRTSAPIDYGLRDGQGRRVPHDVARRASRKLEHVDLATSLDDLKVPRGNRLDVLDGDRRGQHSIAVSDQWRIRFRFEDGDAFDVEFFDYHQR
jgi:proteic killer suppression protein